MGKQLAQTCDAFSNACNDSLAVAVRDGIANNVKLHHACYAEIRVNHGLSANLVVRAIRRVSAAMNRAKRHGGQPRAFRPTSVDYDARIFAFREGDETVSLTVIGDRIHVPLVLGAYQREALRGKKPTAAILTRMRGRFSINIVVEDANTEPPGNNTMGVDCGIRNTAATHHGTLHEGQSKQRYKEKRAAVRASLQSKGTRGARRVLRRLSGHESRHIRHENHVLSKALVSEAQMHQCGAIRLEKLSGIRARTKVRSKHLNRMVNGWSFGELQRFTEYKSIRAGIVVEYVNPAYTSKTCTTCSERGVRRQDVFLCTTCGESHADVNAAVNIAGGGVCKPSRINADCGTHVSHDAVESCLL
jgi:IS605 OrfB family transposase